LLNKTFLMIVLIFCLDSSFSITHAFNCRFPVAEIDKIEAIGEVSILRASKNRLHEWAGQNNRRLCPEDEVIVPKNLPQITITYHSEGPYRKTLTAGEKYTVIALDDPCGALCKAKEKLAKLWAKLWGTEPSSITEHAGWKGGDSISHIFTPLADSAGSAEPFYLFAREGAIPLFWKGGKPPYQLAVKDTKGQVVVQKTLESGEFSFTSLAPEQGLEYSLTIISTKDKTCQKDNSKFCEKKLIFTVPPFPFDSQADPFMQLTTLLGDCQKNWRLEIWRQLSTMPNSKKKQAFMAHLRDNDVGPYDRDIKLCQ